ncbi:MAG: hypothetical protein IJ523_09770 [Succinivibrionaceae bacterium]|nr:hypothetical protein [Succinivibrionaceae bacterium]
MTRKLTEWEKNWVRAECRLYEERKKQVRECKLQMRAKNQENQNPSKKLRALQSEVDRIEISAREVQGGRWYSTLIDNCCRGIPYDKISKEQMPTSHREDYSAAKRQFFALVISKKYE